MPHFPIHISERTCSVCKKYFTQKSSLTTHLLIHNGECPFQCNVCDKQFTLKQHLTKHLRVHSGERPFKCKVCRAGHYTVYDGLDGLICDTVFISVDAVD